MTLHFDCSFITEELIDFLEDYDVFRNPNGVEMSYNSHGTIMVAVNWPDSTEEFDVETFVYAMPLEEFMQTFNVRAINDLKLIKPSSLDHLYEIGKADISCIVVHQEDCYCMQYRKTNNTVMATDDEDVKHIVNTELKTFSDYKKYSFEHYGFAKY